MKLLYLKTKNAYRPTSFTTGTFTLNYRTVFMLPMHNWFLTTHWQHWDNNGNIGTGVVPDCQIFPTILEC